MTQVNSTTDRSSLKRFAWLSIAANRELIARFEKKIQATLARVWGEDEPTPRGCLGEVS